MCGPPGPHVSASPVDHSCCKYSYRSIIQKPVQATVTLVSQFLKRYSLI